MYIIGNVSAGQAISKIFSFLIEFCVFFKFSYCGDLSFAFNSEKQTTSFFTYLWLAGGVFGMYTLYMNSGCMCVLSTCLLFHQNCFVVESLSDWENHQQPCNSWRSLFTCFLTAWHFSVFCFLCIWLHGCIYSVLQKFSFLSILLYCRFSSDWDNHQQPSHSERSWKMPGHRIPTWKSTLLERPGWTVGYSPRSVWTLWYLLSDQPNWRLVCVLSSNKTSAYHSRYSGGP